MNKTIQPIEHNIYFDEYPFAPVCLLFYNANESLICIILLFCWYKGHHFQYKIFVLKNGL